MPLFQKLIRCFTCCNGRNGSDHTSTPQESSGQNVAKDDSRTPPVCRVPPTPQATCDSLGHGENSLASGVLSSSHAAADRNKAPSVGSFEPNDHNLRPYNSWPYHSLAPSEDSTLTVHRKGFSVRHPGRPLLGHGTYNLPASPAFIASRLQSRTQGSRQAAHKSSKKHAPSPPNSQLFGTQREVVPNIGQLTGKQEGVVPKISQPSKKPSVVPYISQQYLSNRLDSLSLASDSARTTDFFSSQPTSPVASTSSTREQPQSQSTSSASRTHTATQGSKSHHARTTQPSSGPSPINHKVKTPAKRRRKRKPRSAAKSGRKPAARGLVSQFHDVEQHIRSYLADGTVSHPAGVVRQGFGNAAGNTTPYFIFKNHPIVTWYTEWISRSPRVEPSGCSTQRELTMINLDVTHDSHTLDTALQQLRLRVPRTGGNVYYHATHAQAAVNILTKGIDLTKCKGRRDFSNNYGFYTTPSYKNSIKWGLRKSERLTGSCGAIVAFKISEKLRSEKHVTLDVRTQQNRQCWGDIVKYFRHGQNSSEMAAMLKGVVYIEGPVLANADFGPNEKPHCLKFDQVCIVDAEYAKRFGSLDNICFVVFYRRR